jgi:hypothetical protein
VRIQNVTIVSYIKGLLEVIDEVGTPFDLCGSYVPDGQAKVEVPASLNLIFI